MPDIILSHLRPFDVGSYVANFPKDTGKANSKDYRRTKKVGDEASS